MSRKPNPVAPLNDATLLFLQTLAAFKAAGRQLEGVLFSREDAMKTDEDEIGARDDLRTLLGVVKVFGDTIETALPYEDSVLVKGGVMVQSTPPRPKFAGVGQREQAVSWLGLFLAICEVRIALQTVEACPNLKTSDAYPDLPGWGRLLAEAKDMAPLIESIYRSLDKNMAPDVEAYGLAEGLIVTDKEEETSDAPAVIG